MRLNNKGFTLIEMIVVTAIFVVVIIITGDAFNIILTQTAKLYKSEESNIEGVIGLEMLRHDLEQAGFGLPEAYSWMITYTEAGYAPASGYNDAARGDGVPRAVVAGNNVPVISDSNSTNGGIFRVLDGTDYLGIKATSVGSDEASHKWTYLSYSSSGKPAKSWPSGNFKAGDNVIMLRRTFQDMVVSNQLVSAPSGQYSVGFSPTTYPAPFAPTLPTDIFYIYGINSGPDVGMPFNRVDYLVAKPSDPARFPSTCEPTSTGILYRASVNHSAGGKLTYAPIMDCVADMQVVFGWNLADTGGNLVTDPNTGGDGQIDTWTNADGSAYSGNVTLPSATTVKDTYLSNPGHIRTKLKLIKVYILAQNGRKDPNYTSPSSITIVDPREGDASLTRPGGFTITSGMQHYRWKVYRLVIKPKNLVSNQ